MSPTSTSDGAPAPPPAVPARPGTAWLLGHFALDVALYLALTLLLTFVAIAALLAVGERIVGPGGTHGPLFVAAALLATALAALALWPWRRPKGGPVGSLLPWRESLALAAFAGLFAQALPWLATRLGLPLDPSNAEPLMGLLAQRPWLAVLLIVGLAPVAEELFFRGVLLRRFALAGRPWLGLWCTAGLFALAHELAADGPLLPRLATLGLYLALGLVFGGVYLRTGRLAAAVAAHALANAIALLLATYSVA